MLWMMWWYSEEYSEEVLNYHEAALKKLREHYQMNKNVFEKVREREELWHKFLAYEVWTDFSESVVSRALMYSVVLCSMLWRIRNCLFIIIIFIIIIIKWF